MDGTVIANNVAIPNTTGWQAWQTVTLKNVALTAGQKVLRVTIGATDYVNLNYIEFTGIVTSLNNESYVDYTLFPNPFNSEGFNIQKNGSFEYSITDLSGMILENGQAENSISVGRNFKNGVYLLTLTKDNISKTAKIIKH
jgi:hypothetical protein